MSRSFESPVAEFGAEENDRRIFKHPLATVFHLFFRVLAIVVYIFAGFLTDSFIICFLLIVILLSLDFWTVKNISGRLLVGLRWWNVVDEEGKSLWRFEARKTPGHHSAMEARVFWLALVVTPLVWGFFAFADLFLLKMSWLIITVLGVAMTGANLYGYLRCKWSSRQEFSSYVSQNLFKSFVSRAAEDASRPPERRPTSVI